MTASQSPADLLTERARVLRVARDIAWVQCQSQAGCARCEAGRGCGGGLFSRLLRGRLQELPVALPPALAGQLGAGDWVLIGLSVRAVQTASMLLYGLPLLGVLAGAIGGELAGGGDPAALLGAVLGLAAGLAIARSLSARLGRGALEPVLLQQLAEHQPCPAAPDSRQ